MCYSRGVNKTLWKHKVGNDKFQQGGSENVMWRGRLIGVSGILQTAQAKMGSAKGKFREG